VEPAERLNTERLNTEHLRLAEQLFEALGSVRRQIRRTAGGPLPSPLSGAQIELVRLIRRSPGVTVSEAAESLGLAGNTVSTLVRQLTDAGVLHRETDPADRRVARLHVTAAARTRIEDWRDRRAELAAQALDRLDASDTGALADAVPALARLVRALQDLEEE
jgi:DNA-binding MarR family transcriptional regulator